MKDRVDLSWPKMNAQINKNTRYQKELSIQQYPIQINNNKFTHNKIVICLFWYSKICNDYKRVVFIIITLYYYVIDY